MVIYVKQKLLEDLNKKVDEIKNIKKQKIIKIIFKNKNWYYDMEIDEFLNIMYDLGYDKETSLKIYKKLVI